MTIVEESSQPRDEPMSIAEIMPAALALSRSDQLQLARLLINRLADEDSLTLREEQVFPIYTPEFAPEAATQLSRLLTGDEPQS